MPVAMTRAVSFLLLSCAVVAASIESAYPQPDDPSLPQIVQKNGRFALFVDGAPFLILGAQTNNSSAWPAMLPRVWPAMESMHVNTVEIPIYWEQFEPEPGRYDFSVVDTIISQAREHGLRLVLLWFATWKNGSNHYMPQWMKLAPERYPNMTGPDGREVDSPSPFAEATLQADITAFTVFMKHLKQVDPSHTVIMVQVENEPGTWQCVRDYSPAAEKAFQSPVPDEALRAMGKPSQPNSNWSEVFGRDGEEFFHVWSVASYIGKVAAAGKAVYPLPLYVNGAVRDPVEPGWPPHYEVGGPNDNVFPLWKAAAPAVDLVAPDIYIRDQVKYLKVLDDYARPDNALFVPETIGMGPITRFFFAALGRGAIGYAPFGMDYTGIPFFPGGSSEAADDPFRDTAVNYESIAPMARDIARLNFESKLQTAIEMDTGASQSPAVGDSQRGEGEPDQVLHFGHWDAEVFFGTFRRRTRNPRAEGVGPTGRVLIARIADDQFLLSGLYTRVTFVPTGDQAGRPWQYLIVEEGNYHEGVFRPTRILNGDQTDWGLFFTSAPTVLRVKLYVR